MSPLGPPPGALSDFPEYELRRTDPYYRIHRRVTEAWSFSSDTHRFDLSFPAGTCYLAEDPMGAFLEVFRYSTLVAEQDILERSLTILTVPDVDRPLADCTVEGARAYGVIGEIHTTSDYALTRAWARAFRDAGFSGVRYRARHDPSQQLISVAFFGRARETFPVDRTTPIPRTLIAEASRRFGIEVLPAPPGRGGFTVVS